MTDLVDQLRHYAKQSNDGYLTGPALEAANEIEYLTAQLAQARAEIAALKPRETLEQVAEREASNHGAKKEGVFWFAEGFLRGVQMQKEGVLPDE